MHLSVRLYRYYAKNYDGVELPPSYQLHERTQKCPKTLNLSEQQTLHHHLD